MKLAYLTELAALTSAHGHLLIEQPQRLSSTLLGDFYVQSRNRFNRWQRNLNDLEQGVTIQDPLHLIGLNPVRPPIQSITEQILINDLLNRVWTVVAICIDRHRQENRVQRLMSNVFGGHLMIRHRALSLCFNGKSLSREQVILINQLRASTERWSDLLCSVMMGRFDLWEYAHDKTRAQEFFQDRFDQSTMQPRNQVWALILAGLRHSFPDEDGLGAPLHDDDRQIARAILHSFPERAGNPAIWSDSMLSKAEK
ncbi:MAG: hypothetical protein MK102_18160 [Fuerstiella sp.]|nr:hypothetical protein [Fuerstiella sp.]